MKQAIQTDSRNDNSARSHRQNLNQLTYWLRLLRCVAQTERGVTLIEILVAILVITVIIVAITPSIFISVATRVQNRKAEEAMQIAQREIELVRVRIYEGSTETSGTNLNFPPSSTNDFTFADLRQVAAPTVTTNSATDQGACQGGQTINPWNAVNGATAFCDAPTAYKEVDTNSDGTADYLVQMYRDASTVFDTVNNNLKSVCLGVRVYAAPEVRNNIGNGGALTNPPEQASLLIGSGIGRRGTEPLVAFYTVVSDGESEELLNQLRESNTVEPNSCH